MTKSKFSQNIPLNWFSLVVLVAIPIILWILPSGQFDDTGIILCPSRFLFDIECFGCGMTRAILHFHHWAFEEAVYHNMFVLVVYPGLVYIWFKWVKHILGNLSLLK